MGWRVRLGWGTAAWHRLGDLSHSPKGQEEAEEGFDEGVNVSQDQICRPAGVPQWFSIDL